MDSPLTRRRSSLSVSVSIDEVDSLLENEQLLEASASFLRPLTINKERGNPGSHSRTFLDPEDATNATEASIHDYNAQVEEGLYQPFVFQSTKPYSHPKMQHLLGRPTSANDWCLRVLEQRWFQSIGSKLLISSPSEFHWYAAQGLQSLDLNSQACCESYSSQHSPHPDDCPCILNANKKILHKWATDIMDELLGEIETEKTGVFQNEDGTWGPYHHHGDGTWQFPNGIVPELVGCLPLPYSLRRKFFDIITEKLKNVPLDISPFPETVHSTTSGKEIETADWSKKMILHSQFLERIFGDFSSVCWEVGVAMKQYLADEYTDVEWIQIFQEWNEDLENDRKEAEWAAEEQAQLEKDAREKEQKETEERKQREAIVRKEKEKEETDRERKRKEEGESQPSHKFQGYSDLSSSDDIDESLSSSSQTSETTRSSSPALSAAQITEALKPINFNWDDSDSDDEWLETSAPPITSAMPTVSEEDQDPSASSGGALIESANVFPTAVEMRDICARSGSDIFDSASELEASGEQSMQIILPENVLPIIAPSIEQQAQMPDVEETDHSSSEDSDIPTKFDLPIIRESLDVINQDPDAELETIDQKPPIGVGIKTGSIFEGMLLIEEQSHDRNLSLELSRVEFPSDDESVAIECENAEHDDLFVVRTPVVPDIKEASLLLKSNEPQPTSSPTIYDQLHESQILWTEKAATTPLPASDDEDYESTTSSNQDEVSEIDDVGRIESKAQSIATTLRTRVILPSNGSYGLEKPFGGSRYFPHLPTAPIQESWRMHAMNTSRQRAPLEESGSHPKRNVTDLGAALGFIVISMALHFSPWTWCF